MAEPLKNYYGEHIPRTIAEMISSVHPEFDVDSFISHVLSDYDELNLMDRGRRIARSMHRFLPDDFPKAIAILIDSHVRRKHYPGEHKIDVLLNGNIVPLGSFTLV